MNVAVIRFERRVSRTYASIHDGLRVKHGQRNAPEHVDAGKTGLRVLLTLVDQDACEEISGQRATGVTKENLSAGEAEVRSKIGQCGER